MKKLEIELYNRELPPVHPNCHRVLYPGYLETEETILDRVLEIANWNKLKVYKHFVDIKEITLERTKPYYYGSAGLYTDDINQSLNKTVAIYVPYIRVIIRLIVYLQ